MQPSRLGACSQRNGPRLSAWHDVHSSAIESPVRSSLTLVAPCVLWQVVHCILPSRTGMWPDRSSFATLSRWHVAQSCHLCLALQLLVSDLGACTLWQVMQPVRESCWLPSQSACSPRLWQVVQVALASLLAGVC